MQDQSRYIDAAMHEIQGHLIVGSILATVVVLVFMRSWRSTLIAAVAIPGSLVSTFAVMRYLDFTLNNVTMLALVLMVGVVIDDAIVVLENVFRFIEEKGMPPTQAAIEGTREIGLAVLATTLSLVIVFLPVSFLSSVTGRMLYQFGMTGVVAILVSHADQLFADADDVLAAAAPRRSRGRCALVAQGLLPLDRAGYERAAQAGHAPSLAGVWLGHRRHRRERAALLSWSSRTMCRRTSTSRSSRSASRPAKAPRSRRWTRRSGPSRRSSARSGESPTCSRPWAASSSAAVNVGEIFVQLEDISSRSFSLARLWRETLAGQPAAAWQRQLQPAGRDAAGAQRDWVNSPI